MKQLLRYLFVPIAIASLVGLQGTAVEAQTVSLKIDKVIDVDTLKVTVSVKQTGMVPTGDPLAGQGVLLSGSIDLNYDPNFLVYQYGPHPVIATNVVYDSFPRTIGALTTTYGPAEAGSVAILPSRLPNPSAGNAPDVCNPPEASCVDPRTRISLADDELSEPWLYPADVYQDILTHHYQIVPPAGQEQGIAQKTASALDVEVDSTTLAICFVQTFGPVTAQCCRANAQAENEVAGFCEIDSPVLLPVELSEFNAAVDNGDVVLNWATASETNNVGFSVEHAVGTDGSFEEVAFVEGAGTSLEARTYNHTVTGLDVGPHRFRLKQLDYDGSFEYSSVVEASIELAGTHRLGAAYPNPFNPSTTFELVVGREQHVKIDVINALGQRVHRLFDGSMEANKPTNFTFEAGALPTGLYFYRVVGENFAQTRQALLVK